MKNLKETLTSIESRYYKLARAEQKTSNTVRFNKLANIYSIAHNKLMEINHGAPKNLIAMVHEQSATFSV
jgi:hypothetical protein